MMKVFLLRRDLNMFLRLHLFMVISPFTTQCQEDGVDSRFQADSLRDLILVSMMKLCWVRKDRNMFLKLRQFTATNHFTTPFQGDGVVNKSQVEHLKDPILALMTRLFWVKRNLSMFQKSHLYMEINLYTTQFQQVGLANKFQEDNSRDQTLVWMTKLSSRRAATKLERSEYKKWIKIDLCSSIIKKLVILFKNFGFQMEWISNNFTIKSLIFGFIYFQK